MKQIEAEIKKKIVEDLKKSNAKIDEYLSRIGIIRLRLGKYGPHPEDISNATNLKKAFNSLIATADDAKITSHSLTVSVKDSMLEFCPVTKGKYWEKFSLILGIFSGKTDLFNAEFNKQIQEKILSKIKHESSAKPTSSDTSESGLELN